MTDSLDVRNMDLNALRDFVGQWAQDKGWNDGPPRTVGDDIALMHSELSEALEEHRLGFAPNEVYFNAIAGEDDFGKPEGIPIELMDVIIRILHFAAKNDIDLSKAFLHKMEYNERRSYRHGGKRL